MKRNKFTSPDLAQVQVQKKNHYTVTKIGNIQDWRNQREQIEAQYHSEMLVRLAEARESAIKVYTGEKQVDLLSSIDKMEIAYLKGREEAKQPVKVTWEMIQAKMNNWDARNEEAKGASYDCAFMLHDGPSPFEDKPQELSLFQQVKSFITRILK